MIGITAITLLALQFMQATAFSSVSKSVARPAISTTSLLAASNDDITTRKDAINTLAAAAGMGLAASIYPSKVNAEEDGGKLIEFTVNNLDGGGTGKFVIKTHPEWAPIGAERFETLSSNGFFEGCRMFRVLPGFVSQFGINGDPDLQR